MEISAIVEEIAKQASNVAPLGASFKFMLDENPIHIDGSGDSNVVTQEDKEADCTISTSIENMIKLKSGELNPMMAVMTKKIRIDGDMGLAMKLQSLI